MAKEHKCENNDHISKVAKQHRFKSWKTIWNENKDFQKKRQDPNVLFKGDKKAAGDVLKLPDLDKRKDLKTLDSLYAWTIFRTKLMLRLRILKDDFSPVKDAEYELKVPGREQPYTGKTNADGKIEHELVALDSQSATLTVRVKPEDADPPPAGGGGGGEAPALVGPQPVRSEVPVTWELKIGALNPIKEQAPDEQCVSGVQQRLNNLNMNAGPVDGKLGANAKAAIKAFQELYQIPVDEAQKGIPDKDKTQAKLYEVHDAPGPVPKPPAPA